MTRVFYHLMRCVKGSDGEAISVNPDQTANSVNPDQTANSVNPDQTAPSGVV